jgi:ABC-2 type transport system ATP-binding protein
MSIITGFISATDGSVSVDGHDVLEEPEEVKRRIGYLPEAPPLYPEMTVVRFLDFSARMKRVPGNRRRECIDTVLQDVGIADKRDRVIGNLSKGYKQRVGLAQALVGSPPILVLDEPTIGLDPRQIIDIRNLIKELGKQHTIILSSHILPEVTAVCDRVVIIHRGAIVAEDTIENLSRKFAATSSLSVRVQADGTAPMDLLRMQPSIRDVQYRGSQEPGTIDVHVTADGDADIRAVTSMTLCGSGYPVLMMKPVDVTLEDIFIQLTTDEDLRQ